MMIDSSDATSDEQRQAAKDFLTWLADSDEGQSFIAETCALVPAFSNNEKKYPIHLENLLRNMQMKAL